MAQPVLLSRARQKCRVVFDFVGGWEERWAGDERENEQEGEKPGGMIPVSFSAGPEQPGTWIASAPGQLHRHGPPPTTMLDSAGATLSFRLHQPASRAIVNHE